jgi:hypothetical protein
MRKILIVVIYLLSINIANAGSNDFIVLAIGQVGSLWLTKDQNNYDKIIMSLATLSLQSDHGTTLDLENHPERKEAGGLGFLNEHPSRGRINTYFISLTLLHFAANYGINRIQDKGIRDFMRTVENVMVIGVHGRGANVNFSAGMSLNF